MYIYISFFDRVYELNLLIYDNDDDDGTMISLNMRILVFFSRYDNKYLSSRFQKDFYTRWCLNFCFFFCLNIFHKIECCCFKIVYETRAGTSIRTVMFPRTLEYSSNRSNNTVNTLFQY